MKIIIKAIKTLVGWQDFRSPIDQFLSELAVKFPKPSLSQRQEINKYTRIYQLRDKATSPKPTGALWDQF